MHLQDNKQTTLARICYECKRLFGDTATRYYCCSKADSVCEQCMKIACKNCKKKRGVALKVRRCSALRCKKIYDQQDMFYDFQGPYFLCPKCLIKDYNFHYQKAIKDKQLPKQVTLDTKHTYPYQDLVVYFRNWCFCCATRIGQQDAFEMIKGARICPSCVSLNIHIMKHMIKCIECQGYIHSTAQIYQTYANQTDVLCKYCAQKQKEHMANQEIEALDSPRLIKKPIISALEKSKLKSIKSLNEPNRILLSKASKVSSVNSFQQELHNLHLKISRSRTNQACELCRCLIDKDNSLMLKRNDPMSSGVFFGVIQKERKEFRVCFVCFGQNFKDRGQTISFETVFLGKEVREQDNNAQVKGIKSLLVQGASHGIFK